MKQKILELEADASKAEKAEAEGNSAELDYWRIEKLRKRSGSLRMRRQG